MNRWASPKRTQADRNRDLVLFCGQARVEAVRDTSADELARRYGVPQQFAEYYRTLRLNREGVV